MERKYQITILRPGGNDTALVKGLVYKEKKKIINDVIMQSFPQVEQVGFYKFDPQSNRATMEMAGGEFCGNATRSLAYLLLNGEKGEIFLHVSGTKQVLLTGVRKRDTAFAQMPIRESFNNIYSHNSGLQLLRR